MSDPKQKVVEVIDRIERGEIAPEKAWTEIRSLKNEYVELLTKHHPRIKNAEQSWHTFIGNKFQQLIYTILKAYVDRIKSRNSVFQTLVVLKEDEIGKNDILSRKLAVRYGDYLLLPDTDLAIVDYSFEDPWKSKILAIVSCKTSLRERIAQACYWKLKLLSSDATKHIKVFLASTDNDNDFVIDNKRRELFQGKSRNRIISEYELDGVYIMREDFRDEWESEKVKKYEKIFDDLIQIFKKK